MTQGHGHTLRSHDLTYRCVDRIRLPCRRSGLNSEPSRRHHAVEAFVARITKCHAGISLASHLNALLCSSFEGEQAGLGMVADVRTRSDGRTAVDDHAAQHNSADL